MILRSCVLLVVASFCASCGSPGSDGLSQGEVNTVSREEVTTGGPEEASSNNAIAVVDTPVLDTTAPKITLEGASTISVMLKDDFVDPGASAYDTEDGDVLVTYGGTVDTENVGRYTLVYSAEDRAGNAASLSRVVTVFPSGSNKDNSSGMGLIGISDWSTAMPFIDLMKQSRQWENWNSFDSEISFVLDENDWVLSLEVGQEAGTIFLTLATEEELMFDRVIVLYDGEGKIGYSWSAAYLPAESSPGRDVVAVKTGSNLLSVIETNVDNPIRNIRNIRNIRIIPEIYFDNYLAGDVFNPDWLSRINSFRALRFMDWMNTNRSNQIEWSDRPKRSDRTWRNKDGAPLEIMIELANLTGADPWFNIPHLADENYMQEFASLVKALLSPTLKVYVEHRNEVWNWGFEQAQYANITGRGRWGDVGNAYMQWHGMKTAQICDAFKIDAFADSVERVKCVLGAQTAYHGLATGVLECPLWVAEGNEPCYLHGIDYIGLTTYFSAGLNGPTSLTGDLVHESTLRSWLEDDDGGLDRAFAQLNYGRELTNVDRYTNFAGAARKVSDEMDYWNKYAQSYDLGLVAYEGGQHITANGLPLFDDPAMVDFHVAINRDPRMEQMYIDIMTAWKDGGGQLHMHFVEMSAPGRYGSWGSLENLSQETSPRWNAITRFNLTEPCWWQGCSD
ncbi:MAG: hypothetical protein ACI93R_000432 [Flavobacteriales bacterium]|jgi:hypothetical protein